jgi:ATP-binding cassette subfamily B protein
MKILSNAIGSAGKIHPTAKTRFIWLSVLLFSSIALQVVNPQIMRFFIDTTQTTQETRLLVIAAIAFISLAMIQQIVESAPRI